MRLKLFNKSKPLRNETFISNNKENTDIRIDNLIISTAIKRKETEIKNNKSVSANCSDSYKAKVLRSSINQ